MKMDWLAKQKTYAVLIFILILLNISILAILWIGRPKAERQMPQKPPDTDMFLKKELGLNENQEELFKRSRKKLFESTRNLDEAIWIKKRELQTEAFKEKPDTLKVNAIIGEIASMQSQIEKYMFKHFSDMKESLNKEQLDKFRKLFDESRKQKREPGYRDGQGPPPQPPGEIIQFVW
jgi:hypothetical protein